MSVLRRIGPYLYSALHSYNSAWELLLLGSERRCADRDADRLRARFSFLAGYAEQARTIRRRLLPAYRAYTATISPDPIAISLELAVFLYVVCEATNPNAMLDLGSGFSSYVFRSYAKSKDRFPLPVTYSVDDSTKWLDETRRFLQHHECDCHNLWTWNDFLKRDRPSFDLVLQDMGDLGTRRRMLAQVLDMCGPAGMLVIDDMHVPGYRRALARELERLQHSYFSLRTFTKKRLRYSYLVLPDVARTEGMSRARPN
jgi:predicted O-methyltransferase YrrM